MATKNTDNQNCGYPQCPIEFLTELLEKLVEAQIVQSEKMAGMRNVAEDCGEKITWIKSQFTNGFRSEIKTHISNHIEPCEQKLDLLTKEFQSLNDKLDTYRQPKFWGKVIVATLFTAASTVLVINGLYRLVHDSINKADIKIDNKLQQNYDQLHMNYDQLKKNYDELIKGAKNGNANSRPG